MNRKNKRVMPWKRNPCIACEYYHPENNTCQLKKVATGGDGLVTMWDRVNCVASTPADEGEEAIDAWNRRTE